MPSAAPHVDVLKSPLGRLGPRVRVRSYIPEVYECLKCGFTWTQSLPTNGGGVTCPLRRCSSLYVEWLSFDVHPNAVIDQTL